MANVGVSVRFPFQLAAALDHVAAKRQSSRSDLVERIIMAAQSSDRDEILGTPVPGPPTEKLNLRLSPEALAHWKALAGDVPPAAFLRRMIAWVVPPDLQPPAAARGDGHEPASARARRRVHADHADVEDGAEVAAAVQAGMAGLVLLAIFLLGALVTLVVWLIWRKTDPPPSGPGDDPRGQLPAGPTHTGGA
jgi:hypothetical protein